LLSYYGNQINKTAEKLLKQGLYDFVGSDVHHDNHINALIKKSFLTM
jgi:tyrosine-protein phosphatase YwqE